MQRPAKRRNQKMARLENSNHTETGIHCGSTAVAVWSSGSAV